MFRVFVAALAAVSVSLAPAVRAAETANPPKATSKIAPPVAPSARSMELTRRYFKAMELERAMITLLDNLIPSMVEEQKGVFTDLDDKSLKAIRDAASETMVSMIPRMVEQMVPVFAASFTEEELQALVTFYESPLGRSITAKGDRMTPLIIKSMEVLQPEVEAEMLERLCRKIDCKGKGLNTDDRKAS